MNKPVFNPQVIVSRFFKKENVSSVLVAIVDRIIGLSKFKKLVEESFNDDDLIFVNNALEKINIEVEYNKNVTIPHQGAYIIISNHPHGILDGMIVTKIFGSYRKDIKILVNHGMMSFNILKRLLVFVDPYRDPGYYGVNKKGMKDMQTCLNTDGMLILFPAGDVSYFQPSLNKIVDKEWDKSCLRFLMKAKCPIIPIYIEGRNSWLYQLGKNIHKKVGLLLMIHELFNKKNKTIKVKIKAPLMPDGLSFGSLSAFEDYLKSMIYK